MKKALLLLATLGLSPLAIPSSSAAQAGIGQCPEPELPQADSALHAMWHEVPEPPFQLDSAVWAATRLSAHPDPIVPALEELIDQYGGPLVAKSLLNVVISGAPYWVWSQDRAVAARAYGELHAALPEVTPLAPLPNLLVRRGFDDEVKLGLTTATTYFDEASRETNLALSTVLCETAFHLRPFVETSSDILDRSSGRTHWHDGAVRLLWGTVRALAVRPGGMEIIEGHLEKEPSPVVAEAIRRWARDPRPGGSLSAAQEPKDAPSLRGWTRALIG